jgi:hypothetical protein
LDEIDFGLDDSRTSIEHLGFGQWHYHPATIDDAIETAQKLISGELCLVEELDAAGKSRGGGLLAPDGVPDTMTKQTVSLRRKFFDREPIIEAIDFSRYFEGQHIWLLHEKKAEIDRIWRENGMPIEEGW